MELKKSPNVDENKLRLTFTLVGLIVAIGLTISAFQWTLYEKPVDIASSNFNPDEEEEIIDITKQEKKKKPPPPPPELEIVEDEEIIEDDQPTLEESDVETGEKVEFQDIPDVDVEEEEEVEEIVQFFAVEVKPKFPGGDEAMNEYLVKNINYPEIEKENGIQGLVVVSFIVNTNGSLSNIQVKKGVTPNINKEAIRVVKRMPRWSPGKQRNKAVKVPVNLPIRFTLSY